MRVGIYSNTDAACGNAEYASDLKYELDQLYPVKCYLGLDADALLACDVILVSWSPSRVPMDKGLINHFRYVGKKVIVIWQESYQTIVDPGSWGVEAVLRAADAVVAHEPVTCSFRTIDYIPHGIPMIGHRPTVKGPSVGVAGFPFVWKNFDFVAQIAKDYGLTCRIIAPYHPMLQNNAGTDFGKLIDLLGNNLSLYQDWMPVQEVVQKLATCTFNMYWFTSQGIVDTLGQSGSVRMGIAAGRPMVISGHRKMKTLFPYSDELYIEWDEANARASVEEILKSDNPRKPNRVLKEQGWPTVAKQYKDLIEKVAA